MRRFIFLILVFVVVACAKDDIATPNESRSIIQLNIGDFPVQSSATRSEAPIGKTSWVSGDELMIAYSEVANLYISSPTCHLAIFDGESWSIEPALTSSQNFDKRFIEVFYRQGMKWDVDNIEYSMQPASGGEFTNTLLLGSEYLHVFNLLESDDHTLTFSRKVDEQNRLLSSILERSSRVRLHGQAGKVYNISCDGAVYIYGKNNTTNIISLINESQGINVTLDADGNALLYLDWEMADDVAPKLILQAEDSSVARTIALPYSANDGIEAPYAYYENQFTSPIVQYEHGQFPFHYNAYAYSIDLTK